MVVPGALLTNQSQVKFFSERRNRHIEAVDLLAQTVTVSNRVHGWLQPTGFIFLGFVRSTQIQIHDIFRGQADMKCRLAILDRQDAFSIFSIH